VTDPTDDALVAAVMSHRDERAFGTLYDRHSPYLYGLALRLSAGDEQVAQGAVHDAWVRAVERFDRYAGRSTLRTWLAGFVVNRLRESWRETEADREEPLPESAAGTDPGLASVPDRVDLERAIAALAPGYRTVFLLHDVEGWTHQAIAERLGIDEGTSKSQLSRARALLRAALA
jgi:RNA polymerase sigma-70 factor (ECF subfamily)